ncbi:hypothetical protein GCM10009804_58430 [Kribbella hippodromi]|uniref:Uncharacterized protein n=2 Tax=Kribbella hippodromi TaxID=434347 RepID=A0ABN2E2C5_9ACTN
MGLSDWIEEHPTVVGAGGVTISDDLAMVDVYWKGTVPPDLQSLAKAQPAAVAFRSAAYSNDELSATAQMLLDSFRGVLTSAGPSQDWSGVVVNFIWDGAWNSGSASSVYRAAAPVLNMRIWLSGGISGVAVYQRYIRYLNRYYSLGSAQPRVGPAFIFMESVTGTGCGTGGCGGVFQPGDSGASVFRYTSNGQKEVFGFLSASFGAHATFCDTANKRPDKSCAFSYPYGYAVNALDALASMGLHAKVG